jgi:3-hydroxy-3-methylglutaryl CoA synthase
MERGRFLSECLRAVLSGRVQQASGLAFCGSTAVEAADHRVDRGPADDGFGDGGVAFVVAGQAAVCGQPGQAALHDPAFGCTAKPRCSDGLRTISIVVFRVPAA